MFLWGQYDKKQILTNFSHRQQRVTQRSQSLQPIIFFVSVTWPLTINLSNMLIIQRESGTPPRVLDFVLSPAKQEAYPSRITSRACCCYCDYVASIKRANLVYKGPASPSLPHLTRLIMSINDENS